MSLQNATRTQMSFVCPMASVLPCLCALCLSWPLSSGLSHDLRVSLSHSKTKSCSQNTQIESYKKLRINRQKFKRMCGPANCNARRAGATKLFLCKKEYQLATRLTEIQKEATTGRRSVSFRESCEVVFVPSQADMTADEHRATWYDDKEFEGILADSVRTVREARKNKNENIDSRLEEDDELCTRGLEVLLCAKLLK